MYLYTPNILVITTAIVTTALWQSFRPAAPRLPVYPQDVLLVLNHSPSMVESILSTTLSHIPSKHSRSSNCRGRYIQNLRQNRMTFILAAAQSSCSNGASGPCN